VAFVNGQFKDPLIDSSNELFALRVPEGLVAKLSPGIRPVIRTVEARGEVVVTNLRVVVVGEGDRILLDRPWPKGLEKVIAEVSGYGAIAIPTSDAMKQGSEMWGVVPPSLMLTPSPPRAVTVVEWILWNRVAAAWFASVGRIDSWQEQTARALRRR
jgi:hypothetical protein